MKILQISPQIPLPLDSGGRISIYGIAKYLADRGNEVHFVAYGKNMDKQWAQNELEKFCKPYILDVKVDNKVLPAFLNLFSAVPYNISKFITSELRDFLKKFFKTNRVDIIHIDHLHLAWSIDLIRDLTDAPVVLREHNLEMRIMQRFSEIQKNFFIKNFARMQFEKFKHYEPALCEKFDKCIMISPDDEKLVLQMNSRIKTTTIPAGVKEELTNLKKKNPIPFSMFHLGSLKWLPNMDGLMWYIEEVFPYILKSFPQLKLYLYSEGIEKFQIPDSFKNNIIKVGYVEDIWSELMDKSLAIIPLRVGSGIRVKIIEMLAAGLNIITTSVGKEGIEVEDGKHLLVADTADDFISKTIAYFNHEYDNSKISADARELVMHNYSWEKIAERFEMEYLRIIKNNNIQII